MNNTLIKVANILTNYGYHNQANKIKKLAQQDKHADLSDKINNDPQFSNLLRARKGIDKNLLVDDEPVIIIGFKQEARESKSEQERQSIAQSAVEKYAPQFGFSNVSYNGIVNAGRPEFSYNPTATVDTSPPEKDPAAGTLVFSFSLK